MSMRLFSAVFAVMGGCASPPRETVASSPPAKKPGPDLAALFESCAVESTAECEFVLVSPDDARVAVAFYAEDGGRGFHNFHVVEIDVATGDEVRRHTVLEPTEPVGEDGHLPAEARPGIHAEARRVADSLAAWSSLPLEPARFAVTTPPTSERPTMTGELFVGADAIWRGPVRAPRSLRCASDDGLSIVWNPVPMRVEDSSWRWNRTHRLLVLRPNTEGWGDLCSLERSPVVVIRAR